MFNCVNIISCIDKTLLCCILMMLSLAESNGGEPGAEHLTITVENCRLEALERSSVAAQREGYLLAMPFQPGDSVAAETMLAALATEHIEQHIAKATAELESLTITSENKWRAESARIQRDAAIAYKRLLDQSNARGARITNAEYLEQDKQIDQANAELESAKTQQASDAASAKAKRAEIAIAKLDLSHSIVKTPFAGIIAQIYHRRGEYVRQGDPIAEIVRLDKLAVSLALSQQTIAPHVVAGARVELAVAIIGNQPSETQVLRFQGKITGVLPDVERDGRFLAITEIDNLQSVDSTGVGQWILRPGMIGKAIILFEQEAASNKNDLAGL